MPLAPLTHHEILSLVEPFSRRGRRVDLEASDRLNRRLAFRPLEIAEAGPGQPPLTEALQLESPYAGTFRIRRSLRHPSGLEAWVEAEGPGVAELLALVEGVPPRWQFLEGPEFVLARSYRAELPGGQAVLAEGVAEVAGLRCVWVQPTSRGAAQVSVTDPGGDSIALPEDLLAVLGWGWSPLTRIRGSWVSRVRVGGKGPERSRRAERALERTVRHLAATLGELPRRFHERFLAARWGVALRRTIPVLTAAGLVALVAALPGAVLDDPAVRLAALNLPILVVALSFTLQEGARVELPPLPRRSVAPAWRTTVGPGGSTLGLEAKAG